MAYSTIPAAIDQLLVSIAARPGLSDVHVGDGLPATLPEEHERIYVDDAIDVEREWAQLGQYRIDETYTIKVHVEVYQAGDERTETRHRLFELIAEVEQAAVLDITLAGVLNWGVRPDTMNPTVIPTDEGWLGQATLNLVCSARIQAS